MLNSIVLSMNETNNTLMTDNFPAVVRLWTYLIFDILSVTCSLFVLFYLLSDRTLRRAFSNHVIIVLLLTGLLIELICVPWIIYRSYAGLRLIRAPLLYLLSFVFEYGLSTTQTILFTWATLERHILIFHHQWISTKKKRFVFHYLPIIMILVYCLIYYCVVTFGPFCQNSFVGYLAGSPIIPCIYSINTGLALWEGIGHQAIPTLIIIIFSFLLIARVLRQKRNANQPIRWRNHRKMTIQLLCIASLYLTFNAPWTILLFLFQYNVPMNTVAIYTSYGIYFRTYVVFLYPFVCFGSSKELRNKFKKIVFWRQQRSIHPQ